VAVTDAGPQRFPFVAISDGFPMTSNAPESIEIELSFKDEVIATETVGVRGVGQFTPYYPLVFTPPAAGRYVARTTFSDIDVEFTVEERTNVALFQVGDQLPAFDTPTFDSGRGVNPVCTRAPDLCPFHEMTLTEAIENERPTALLIASPAFCQSDVCGPSVEFFIAAAQNRDDMNFVHAEVFADPENTGSGRLPPLAPLLGAAAHRVGPRLRTIPVRGQCVWDDRCQPSLCLRPRRTRRGDRGRA